MTTMLLHALSLVFAFVGLVVVLLLYMRVRRPAGREMELALRDELRSSREEAARQARDLREEVTNAQGKTSELIFKTLSTLGEDQKALLELLTKATRESAESTRTEIEQRFEKVRQVVGEQLQKMLEDQRKQLAEVVASLNKLSESNRQDQEKARDALDQKFRQIQESNEKKLDDMRKTVDEKLHSTLEKRLGESFKLVSERLEAVQRGLGEMQTLATGVGDLKRVLTNVKERGTWGEYELGAILADCLAPSQFSRNVRPMDGGEQVEFAVKLPGKNDDADKPVWLPIDAKFPKEDYERLLDAANRADAEQVRTATKALYSAISKSAKDISEKYISPPSTTDFAIMFLPTEGLYAEVLRQPGLHDDLQRNYRVLVAGPTTLSAILSSLRVGFQTLVIEKRAHEVWKVLGAVKTEFGKFGGVLEKVQKQLNTASKTLDDSARRTRAMQRSLRTVEELPSEEASALLELASPDEPPEDEITETSA